MTTLGAVAWEVLVAWVVGWGVGDLGAVAAWAWEELTLWEPSAAGAAWAAHAPTVEGVVKRSPAPSLLEMYVPLCSSYKVSYISNGTKLCLLL